MIVQHTYRDAAALAVWDDDGGAGAALADDRVPAMSWFSRIFGARHHHGALGPASPARPPPGAAEPDRSADADLDDAPLIQRARD